MAEFIPREALRDEAFITKLAVATWAREVEERGFARTPPKSKLVNAVKDVTEAIYLNAPVKEIPTEEELETTTQGIQCLSCGKPGMQRTGDCYTCPHCGESEDVAPHG